MKKLFMICLVVMLVLPCFALNESTDMADDFTGEWYLVSLQADAYEFKPVLLTEGDLALSSMRIMTLSEDGSGTIADLFTVTECTWSKKDGGAELVIDGQAYNARLENGRLYLGGMADPFCPVRSMRYTFVFSRQVSYAAVPPVTNTRSQEELFGTYTGAYMLQGGKVRKLTENVRIELSESRIIISLEDETIELDTAFDGDSITAQLSDAEGSYVAWLLAGYTDIRIRPCEMRDGIIAADAVGEDGGFGFRIYFASDESDRTEHETPGATVNALDTAFEADSLKLARVELPPPAMEDVILEIPDGSFERIGKNTQDIRKGLDKINDFSEMVIGTLAPGGKTGLAVFKKTYFAYCDGKYQLIHPSPDKGADDVHHNLAGLLLRKRGVIPYEGIVYSPDGRYAVIPNTETAINNRQYNADPALIDLWTGEIRLIETFDNQVFSEDFGTMISACFSADSETLYYTVFTRLAAELHRYSMKEEKAELILRTPEMLYNTQFGTYWTFSGLALTPDGSFAVISDSEPNSGIPQQLVLLRTKDEIVFTVEPNSIPDLREHGATLTAFSYSPESDHAILDFRNKYARSAAEIPSGRVLNLPDYLTVVKPDKELEGLDILWAIQADPLQTVGISADGFPGDFTLSPDGFCRIQEVEQSPDGRYALLLVTGHSEYKLLLLRLSDMSLRQVEGINASDIRLESKAKDFPPVIDWNADMLSIFTNDALGLYRFE